RQLASLPLPPRSIRIPMYLVWAVLLSAAATIFIGVPCLMGNTTLYTESQALLILLTHFLVLLPPMAFVLGSFRRRRDFLHPSFLAGLSFMVFQILVNPVIYGNRTVLASRKLDISSSLLRTETILHTYLVLLVAWCSFLIGHSLLKNRDAV